MHVLVFLKSDTSLAIHSLVLVFLKSDTSLAIQSLVCLWPLRHSDTYSLERFSLQLEACRLAPCRSKPAAPHDVVGLGPSLEGSSKPRRLHGLRPLRLLWRGGAAGLRELGGGAGP